MCGIIGYVADEKRPYNFRLPESIGWLRHRGPDQHGIWEKDGVGLGHTRLCIIDLSGGRQPMLSPDGRYILIFNGEIYNFLDLRQDMESAGEIFAENSDTEVLLRLFIREGIDGCLKKLRGMFAFAVWDRVERTLCLARDRLGVKPLVYAETNQGFIFASEIGALFELWPALPRNPDYTALDHYLTFQYIPSPLSGFASVRKLPPAHALLAREGKIERIWRYWKVDSSKTNPLPFTEACEALRAKFVEATRIRLISDVPLGAFLSGGIDSSITVAAMARIGANPLKTFAIGFEDEQFNELPYARQVAQHLGTDHHEMIVKPKAIEVFPELIAHFGEPLADNSAIPTYYVSQFARRSVTVALTGDGGDETFGGYRRFYHATLVDFLERWHLLPIWREMRRLTAAWENLANAEKDRRPFPSLRKDEILFLQGVERYKHLLAFYLDQEKEDLLTADFRAQVGQSQTTEYLASHMNQENETDPINRYLLLDMTTYLPEDILFKVDISSMLNSLECRSPFLDHELIEFVASLPGRYKLKPPQKYKYLLKETFKEWLPPGFMNRNKMGFSAPMPGWLKNELAPLMCERLLVERSLSPWIQQQRLQRYVEEHLAGEKSHSKHLWPLLVLAEWVRRFNISL
jgi:asparagine synthase (glutamine-hydrolysing)